MSTLPLDVILKIVDIGKLDICDVFHLYQVNQLMRNKLSHGYFWHGVYNILFKSHFSHYEINTSVENHYLQCVEYYHVHMRIKNELRDSIDIGSYVDYEYIPIVYNLFTEELNQLNVDSNVIDLTNCIRLNIILQAQITKLALEKLSKLASLKINGDYYEQLWFSISLIQPNTYKLIYNRRPFLNKLKSKFNQYITSKYPEMFNSYEFESFAKYYKFIKTCLNYLYKHLVKYYDDSRYIMENFNILYMYSGAKSANPMLLASVAMKVLFQSIDLDKLSIRHYKQVPRPVISTFAIVIGFIYIPLTDQAELEENIELTLQMYPSLQTFSKPMSLESLYEVLNHFEERIDLSWRHYQSHGYPYRDNRRRLQILLNNLSSIDKLVWKRFFPIPIQDECELKVSDTQNDANFDLRGCLVLTKRTNQLGILLFKSVSESKDTFYFVRSIDDLGFTLRENSFTPILIDHKALISFIQTFGFESLYSCSVNTCTIDNDRIRFH